jgi:hypothetical protein
MSKGWTSARCFLAAMLLVSLAAPAWAQETTQPSDARRNIFDFDEEPAPKPPVAPEAPDLPPPPLNAEPPPAGGPEAAQEPGYVFLCVFKSAPQGVTPTVFTRHMLRMLPESANLPVNVVMLRDARLSRLYDAPQRRGDDHAARLSRLLLDPAPTARPATLSDALFDAARQNPRVVYLLSDGSNLREDVTDGLAAIRKGRTALQIIVTLHPADPDAVERREAATALARATGAHLSFISSRIDPPAGVPGPAVAALPPDKQPVPAGEALQAALREVQTAFPDLGSEPAIRAAMGRLVRESRNTSNSPAVRYALMQAILDAAIKVGDPNRVRFVVNDMDRLFKDVDAPRLKLDAAQRIHRAGGTDPGGVAYLFLDGAQAAAEDEHPELASATLPTIESLLPGVTDPVAQRGLAQRLKDVRRAVAAAEQMRPYRASLKTNPADPTANLMVGWFHCVIARDWPAGLALLAKCDNPGLKSLAEKELSPSLTPQAALQVADAWWDIADAPSTSEEDRPWVRMHAAGLYRQHRQAAEPEKANVIEQRIRQGDEERSAMARSRSVGRAGAALIPTTVTGGTARPTTPLVATPAVPRKLGAPAATPEIHAAIRKAVDYLYDHHADGTWEANSPMSGTSPTNQSGGQTAMVAYALLCAGEAPDHPKLAAAIKWEKSADVTGTYALAFRALLWSRLIGADPTVKDLLRRDADVLGKGAMSKQGEVRGVWHYGPTQNTTYDHSTSQYGLLGMTTLERAGIHIPPALWKAADETWRKNQLPDGSWAYTPNRTAHSSAMRQLNMTAAGVASLLVAQEYLRSPDPSRRPPANEPLDRGLAWLHANFSDALGPGGGTNSSMYGLFGVKRIGEMTGAKYLGSGHWYPAGARALLDHQDSSGAFGGNVSNTAFAVLFLAHGRSPVAVNKLQYKIDGKDAAWNSRWRDLAAATRFLARQTGHDYHWQVATLDQPLSDLTDAPVLYLSGGQGLKFSDEEQQRLRQYIQQGGLIVGNAEGGDARFVASFRELARTLVGQDLSKTEPTDPLLDRQHYKVKTWRMRSDLEVARPGGRTAMVLIPGTDLGRALQSGDDKAREEQFQLFANLLLHGQQLRPR